MRKLVVAALAGVFMWSSSFDIIDDQQLVVEEDFFCQSSCSFVGSVNGQPVLFEFYSSSAGSCSTMTNGYGTYDSNDCQSGAGMLNSTTVEELKAAEKGC
ncbi:hypothetical protein [Nonlabens sp.]|uniref:hypothetical protein n=1 Tax=Nonlabens sp. TaxID=1888209 RepID=UPI001BCFB895|nr:hypothetical protein [Nonlabens sp.]